MTYFPLSHRTVAEQAIGAALLFLLCFLFQGLDFWFSSPPFFLMCGWSLCTLAMSGSSWMVWRSHSLRTLKVEAGLFLVQLFLKSAWFISFFVLREALLALMILVLLLFTSLTFAFFLWQKQKPLAAIWSICLLWIFYVGYLNMNM